MERRSASKLVSRGFSLKAKTLLLLLYILQHFFSSGASAQIPPAGESVYSQSFATYYSDHDSLTAVSNEVSLNILPLYGPAVLPDGDVSAPALSDSAFSLETVTFPFTVFNSGNEEDAYSLRLRLISPSDFSFTSRRIYRDDDGDGTIEPGEEMITSTGTMAAGETMALVVEAGLPDGLTGGETAHLNLIAASGADTSEVDRDNVVRAVAREEARIELTVDSDMDIVMPGDTLALKIDFTNAGEREAADVIISNYIDCEEVLEGARLVPGSVVSTIPGDFEYLDQTGANWLSTPPPAEEIRAVRLVLDGLPSGESGSLSFRAAVPMEHTSGMIYNSSFSDYTGGDSNSYRSSSNRISILIGRLSSVFIGPAGNAHAPEGSTQDMITININGADSIYTFWHDVAGMSNFTDTLAVCLADSADLPADWEVDFVDSTGASLRRLSEFAAAIGPVASGEQIRAGVTYSATPEDFRDFPGREIEIGVEAFSLVNGEARDAVTDVLVKTQLPLLSLQQSIKEPVASIGDVLSCILTVTNIAEQTTVDSIEVVEDLCAGMGYAGSNIDPRVMGNRLVWRIGSLEPGAKKEIVFRIRVKAGQQRGNLTGSASVSGITGLGEFTAAGPAVASIQLVEGIFTRKGIVTGTVFLDSNGSGRLEKGERGVAGVSVFVENGTYCVTDSAGKYSIPGLEEGTHVLRVDPQSFPDTLTVGDGGHFGMGTGGQALIDLPPSGNRRVDFALVPGPEAAGGAQNQTDFETADRYAAKGKGTWKKGGAGLDLYEAGGGSFPGRGIPAGEDDTLLARDYSPEPADTSERFSSSGAADAINILEPPYDVMTFRGSGFQPGSAVLKDIPLERVAKLAIWLREHPRWKLFIEGHTDSVPIHTEEFPSNLELSLARARSVFQLFRMNGIPEERMDYTGVGARKPAASNSTPEGRAGNRRVVVEAMPPEDNTTPQADLYELIGGEVTAVSTLLARDAQICPGIVFPEEGHLFRKRDRIEVRVVSELGSQVDLYVNNVPVGREKIGRKEIDSSAGTIANVFYGVKVKPGKNTILVVTRERGGEKSACARHVYLAGKPAAIVPERRMVSVNADGKSTGDLVFMVIDSSGLPVRDGVFIDVEGPSELIEALDVNPHLAGVQAATEDGRVALNMPAGRDVRRARISLRYGDISAGSFISYESAVRDWFLFGYGEADVGVSNFTGEGTTRRSAERFHDGLFAEGKISLYGQGRIAEDHLLTLALDSRPVKYDKLLDRIEPEKHYPIYGDAGELRFNSSSRSGTYLKLEHKRYTAMFGDFRTDFSDMELSRYERTFTGLSGKLRFKRGSAKAFITRTDQVTYQEEIPADGTSGFYFLKHYPLIENSEKIRIEVRDRYRPEKILRVDYKQINRDYDINYNDGSLLFKEPIPSVDQDLNPVTIVVSYECSNTGERNFIYGTRSAVSVTDSLTAGLTALLEEEGVENSSLVGVDLSGTIIPSVNIEAEYAHSEKFLLGGGDAFRIELSGRRNSGLLWNVYYREIDENFFNPSFSGGKTELGSRKYGMKLDWRINSRVSLKSHHYRHRFMERDEEKGYFDVRGEYSRDNYSGMMGLAGVSHSDMREGDHDAVLILAGISAENDKTRAQLRYDQKVAGEEVQEYPNRLEAKLSRRIWKKLAATLDHEYRTGSRSSTRHRTRIGVESDVTEDLSVYSRYRLEGAMSGERGQATIGLKNRFRLSSDLTGTFMAEKLATVSGMATDDFTSVATSWNYTPSEKDYRMKGDYEVKFETARIKHLFSTGGIKRMDRRWSGMARGDLWFSDEKDEANRAKANSTLGLSFRPEAAEDLTLLSLIRLRYEKNSPAHPGGVDKQLVLSSEANYALNAGWQLEGKIAAKWAKNTFRKITASAAAFMYQAQVIKLFPGRWDLTFMGRILHQRETGTIRYGTGIEAGKIVMDNLWVGGGYTFAGHSDSEVIENEFRESGFHLGMKMKFDEKLLNYFYR